MKLEDISRRLYDLYSDFEALDVWVKSAATGSVKVGLKNLAAMCQQNARSICENEQVRLPDWCKEPK